MKFTLLTALFFSALALATPAPKEEEKLIRVVIHYVDAPDCDYQCGVNTTSVFPTTSSSSSSTTTSAEPTTTLTSTSTKYVIVTLQTGYGTTETLGYETATTVPSEAPAPTY